MKKLLYILSFIMLLCSSCVTQKKCNAKFPPQTFIKDSIVFKDTVIYKDTVIHIPGETLTATEYIHDTLVFVDTVIFGNKTQLHLQVDKGKIKATCIADSLQLVINNLQKIISQKTQIKTETITKNIEVPKPYVPLWLILIMVVSIGWNFRKLIFQTLQKLLQ